MLRITNVDWLALYIGVPGRPIDGRFVFQKENYSSAIFEEIYTVYDSYLNERVATLQRKPFSKIIPEDAGIIKIDNRLLYRPDWNTFATYICDSSGFEIRSISRIDICTDFNTFKNGLHPKTFIKRFLNNDYVKMGNSKYSIEGEQQEKTAIVKGENRFEQDFQYIRFGTREHEVSSYLYNKSLELQQVKDKPYIRQAWKEGCLDLERDVWRLEFSLRNKQMRYILNRTGEQFRLDLDFLATQGVVDNVLCCAYQKYFDFRIYDGQQKKCRMKRVELLSQASSTLSMYVPTNDADSNRMDKIILNKLVDTRANLRIDDEFLEELLTEAAYQYAKNKDMLKYLNEVSLVKKRKYKQ